MNIKIERLNITNQNSLFSLFENSHYEHSPSWKTCYCRFYHTTCSMDEWITRSKDTNRNEAMKEIKSGKMQGFLAMDNDKCVGWVNAAPIINYPRLEKHLDSSFKNPKTALTICFVIDEEYRGLKISSMLLDTAIDFFKTNGYERMIALPVHSDVLEKMYRGIKQMYLNRGYVEISCENDLSVMSLDLV